MISIYLSTFVQLMICFICWTMGSYEQLRKFDCHLVRNKMTGQFEFKFILKESVLGQGEQDEEEEEEEQFTSMMNIQDGFDRATEAPMRPRGDTSLYLKRGVDAIMQQFFRGLEEQLPE